VAMTGAVTVARATLACPASPRASLFPFDDSFRIPTTLTRGLASRPTKIARDMWTTRRRWAHNTPAEKRLLSRPAATRAQVRSGENRARHMADGRANHVIRGTCDCSRGRADFLPPVPRGRPTRTRPSSWRIRRARDRTPVQKLRGLRSPSRSTRATNK
jgi:hypothetical protein